jgi:hypothetical protein
MKLRKMLTKKVGHISDTLWLEALAEAKSDILAHKKLSKWNFDNWGNRRKLIYIVNVMAVYIRMVCKFNLYEEVTK